MLLIRNMKIATILLFSTFIASCAGTSGGRVSEQHRDTTGTYDGTWKVDVQKAISVQTFGQWIMNCGDMRQSFIVYVNDGAMTFSGTADGKKAYVSSSGDFEISIPLPGNARAAANPGLTLFKEDRRLMLSGKLAPDGVKSAGYITYGIAEMLYAGCTSKTTYSLISRL